MNKEPMVFLSILAPGGITYTTADTPTRLGAWIVNIVTLLHEQHPNYTPRIDNIHVLAR